MMSMCCAVLGLVMLVLTNLAGIIAYATPYWISMGRSVNRGLWAYCDPDICTWVFQDSYAYMEHQDSAWWQASQGLMSTGLLMALLALIVATVMLCCECKGCNCSLVVAAFLIIAALMMGLAVTVFGICANLHLDVTMDSIRRFSWSFWLTVAASGLALFSSMVYALQGLTRERHPC